MYVQLNERDELSWCQRPIDEEGDSFDNKKNISARKMKSFLLDLEGVLWVQKGLLIWYKIRYFLL